MDRFNEFGVPASPVLGPEDLEGNRHTADRHLVVTSDDPGFDGVRWVAPPVAVPGERFTVRHPAPQLGEHTGIILRDLGHDAARVAELAAEGVVVDAALSGLPL
jgi:crotonobetainyl-CoA:carnitine CoA-transferase CaiB-like acyl-CoA transferase